MSNIKTFVLTATVVILASLFNVSCEKEQPASEKSAVGYSERESMEQQPQSAEVSQHKEMERKADIGGDEEDVSDDSDEDENDEEDVSDDSDEDEVAEEDTGDESDEDEGEPKE